MTLIVAFCMEAVRLPKHKGRLASAKESEKIYIWLCHVF
jgi:hypothetical protein